MNKELKDPLFEIEKKEELKATLNMISNGMVLPLYFLFWICDIIFVPEFKWTFLLLRASVIPASIIVQYCLKRVVTLRQSEWLALSYIVLLASVINTMIFFINTGNTPYYAGLNLVAIGSLTFIPWSRNFFFGANIAIFMPYFLISLYHTTDYVDLIPIALNSFFIVGTIVITLVIRMFHNRLRARDFKSRMQLSEEIGNRDQIIIEKTEEGMRLAGLSRQFSPQLVDAIKSRKITFDSTIHRSKICAIFIDIVNSTERVANVDKDKVHKSISRFFDDTVKILLKYDITIDKFLGDGILAFSNDPVKHDDFVQRVLFAAFEIKKVMQTNTEFYQENWLSPMQIKIGVSVGFANVGFYGSDRYFKSYTAIGPVVNLASRMCSSASPNQILIDSDILAHIDRDQFVINFIGKLSLKGFESTEVAGYEINAKENSSLAEQHGDCPKCTDGFMQLATDKNGIYIIKCNKCDFKPESNAPIKKVA
jgi:adenylate cyclase